MGQLQAWAAPADPPVVTQNPTAANENLPDRWTVEQNGSRLVWEAPRPLAVLDERIDIAVDGQVLPGAQVSEDGRTVSVEATDLTIEDPSTLRVMAGARRLDEISARATAPAVPSAASAPSPSELPAWDPGKRGAHRTHRGEYTVGSLKIEGFEVPVEMQAQVVVPLGATGPRPVALFLHGRHVSCYNTSDKQDTDAYLAWPCPRGWEPAPSYRGYTLAQDLLASQGWITLSISANGINAQDQVLDGGAVARSALVREHLSRWAAWSASDAAWAQAPSAVRAGPRPDLSHVLLVGHSRGGEGVNHAALDSSVDEAAPWRVRGQLLIAPTAFSRNPAPGVPTVVLLPACDGDVSDLEGQYYLDAARDVTTDPALRSAVYVEGTNHNFFNTEWTPGLAKAPADNDWWGDPSVPESRCGSKAAPRLTAQQQRTVGAVYTATAARALVLGETNLLPVLDGSALRPRSVTPAKIHTHALGGHRKPLLVPTGSTSVVSGLGTTGSRCLTARAAGETSACLPPGSQGNTPSFGPFTALKDEPTRTVVTMKWRKSGGASAIAVTSPAIPDESTALAMRIAVPPAARNTQFEVRLTDTAGHSLSLGSRTLSGLPSAAPAGAYMGSYWAQEVRLPLDRAAARKAKVDLTRIKRLQFVSRSRSGDLWLLDAWSYRSGQAAGDPVVLPVFDMGIITVDEGDANRTVDLPVTVRGTIHRTATMRIGLMNQSEDQTSRTITVAPGTTRFTVPVKIKGNAIDSSDRVFYKAVGIGTGQIVASTVEGYVEVHDDDPSPPLTVGATATTTEGGTLKWTFTRSAPSETPIFIMAHFQAPKDGAKELTVGDLSPQWVAESGYVGSLGVPLSRSGIAIYSQEESGARVLTLRLPIRKDKIKEGLENVRLRVPGEKELPPEEFDPIPGLPGGATLVGTVKDAS
ncbi:MAG: hypothetical protein QG608_3027 [Actinomycetota bacterium]|nr:hypothetical protein [Actinomycetota bacterium]